MPNDLPSSLPNQPGTTEELCWAIRQFVRLVPAGGECRVELKVGAQSFLIGTEPMPEDEAAHFAGLFVFALTALVQKVNTPAGGNHD